MVIECYARAVRLRFPFGNDSIYQEKSVNLGEKGYAIIKNNTQGVPERVGYVNQMTCGQKEEIKVKGTVVVRYFFPDVLPEDLLGLPPH